MNTLSLFHSYTIPQLLSEFAVDPCSRIQQIIYISKFHTRFCLHEYQRTSYIRIVQRTLKSGALFSVNISRTENHYDYFKINFYFYILRVLIFTFSSDEKVLVFCDKSVSDPKFEYWFLIVFTNLY